MDMEITRTEATQRLKAAEGETTWRKKREKNRSGSRSESVKRLSGTFRNLHFTQKRSPSAGLEVHVAEGPISRLKGWERGTPATHKGLDDGFIKFGLN